MNEALRSSREDGLVVSRGEATPLSSTLFFQLPRIEPHVNGRLSGRLRGPLAAGRKLLAAEYPLVDLGPGPTRLARVAVPDPCYWSPELPAVYEAQVEWHIDDVLSATWTRSIALRRQGFRRRSLHVEGQRLVLRGILERSLPSLGEPVWEDWKETGAVAVVTEPTDDQLRAASDIGVRIAVAFDEPAERGAEALRHWTRWPAVVACVTPRWDGDDTERRVWRQSAGGAWILQRCDAPEQKVAWTDGAWVTLDSNVDPATTLANWGDFDFPLVVDRRLATPADFPTARQAIDSLQRDLATIGDFAGYVV